MSAATGLTSVELFAGAGGLALGTAGAGFRHRLVTEWNRDACETLRNGVQRVAGGSESVIVEADVRDLDFSEWEGSDLVAGGPPCQPFSIGGKHRGEADSRNLFPEMLRAVRQVQPRAVLIENVRGLMRPAFSQFLAHIVLQLTYPSLLPRQGETWPEHLRRLDQHHSAAKGHAEYRVLHRVLNAADYGVPQRRERAFIVAFRADVGVEWSFPRPTHSAVALLRDKWVAGAYWERHGRAPLDPTPAERRQLARSHTRSNGIFGEECLPWRTVRDALADLPEPVPTTMVEAGAQWGPSGHFYSPGARRYPGHTGSPLDLPSKTLKAGDHGVPGGENMLVLDDDSVRYMSVREAARIQTFPDAYEVRGSWTECMRQLGNAVPVSLAEVVGRSIAEALLKVR